MAQIIRRKEHQHGEDDEIHHQPHAILRRVIRVEGKCVLRTLGFDPKRVVRTRDVQRGDMQEDHAENHEGQQIMQAEEAVERRVIHAEAAPEQFHDEITHNREGAEQVRDDGGAPEGHLTPGQHIAHKGGRHHQQEDHDPQHPQQFTRRLVRTVIHAAEDVDIDHNEEHAGAVHVNIADQPAKIHIAHDAFDTVEGKARMRGVMHRQEDTRRDHDHQRDHGQRAEIPEIIEILRRREGSVFLLHHGEDRHALIYPAHHRILEFAIVQPD